MTTIIILLVLLLLLVGASPMWPYSRSWGYYPSGILAVIMAVVLVLLILRVI